MKKLKFIGNLFGKRLYIESDADKTLIKAIEDFFNGRMFQYYAGGETGMMKELIRRIKKGIIK